MDNVVLLNVSVSLISRHVLHASALLEGSDKLARDAFVHSGKVFTSLVVFNASIISHNSGAPTDITVGAP